MVAQSYPTLNQNAVSWAEIDTTFTVAGGKSVETADYSDISLKDSMEVGEQKGAGGIIRRYTAGAVSQEGSVTFYRSGFRTFQKAVIERAPTRGNQVRIGLVLFDVLIQHSVDPDPEIYVLKMKGCRIKGREWSFAEGVEADKVTVPLLVTQIVEIINGKEVVLL
jgi:hypothetical protein